LNPKPSEDSVKSGKDVRLSLKDREPGLAINENGTVCQSRSQNEWQGGRANVGILKGSLLLLLF